MIAVLVALTNLLGGVGFAQALIGRWRIGLLWVAAATLAILVTAMTVWGIPLLIAVFLGSLVDAFLRTRKLRSPIRWDGLAAGLWFGGMIVFALGTRTFVIEAFKIPSSAMYPTFKIGDHIYADKLSIRWSAPKRGEVIIFAMPCEPSRDYIKRVIAVAGDTVEIRCSKLHINGVAVGEELVEPAATYEDFEEARSFYGRETEGHWFARDVSHYRETIDGHSFGVFHDVERPDRDRARAAGNQIGGDPKDFPSLVIRHCGNPDGLDGSNVSNQSPGKLVETKPEPANGCELHRHFVVPEDSMFVMGDSRSNSNDSRYWGVVPVENVRGRATGIWLPLSRFGGFD